MEMLEQDKLDLEEELKMEEQARRDEGRGQGKGAKGNKGRGKDTNAPPTVSMRAQQAAKGGSPSGGGGCGKASPPATSGVERRQALPQANDDQKRQFKEDLVHWSQKFDCLYKFIGPELAVKFKDEQQADL